jgi:hypothetical protein
MAQIPLVPGPGTYPVGNPSAAVPIALGLSTSGNGCDAETGTLTVTRAAYDATLKPVLFSASYAISCDTKPTTYGDIRWNATTGYRNVVAAPDAIGPVEVPVGTPSTTQTVTVSGFGTQTTTFGTAAITGPAASDWAITTDSCSGLILAMPASCQIAMTFTPGSSGDRPAVLTLPDTTARGARVIDLDGVGVVPPSTPATTVRVALHRAEVNWIPPADDGGADITGYHVYRWVDGGTQTLVDTVDTTSPGYHLTYDDSGLITGQTYHYGVTATNLSGTGPESDAAATVPHDELLLGSAQVLTTDGGAPITLPGYDTVGPFESAVVPGGHQFVYSVGFDISANGLVLASTDGSGSPVRLTTMGATNPAVSMDGRTVAFVHYDPSGVPSIWTVPITGGTPVERVSGYLDPSWLPDGQSLVAAPGGPLVTISPSNVVTAIPGTANALQPAVSPDGKWIAYKYSDLQGTFAFAVIAIAGGTPRLSPLQAQQVSDISWRTDGHELFADSGVSARIFEVPFDPVTGLGTVTTIVPPELSSGPLFPSYVNDDAVSLASVQPFTKATPTIGVKAPATAATTCSLDGGPAVSCATSWTPAAPLAAGHHELFVSSTPVGGIASSSTWAFTVDTTAPVVSMQSPSTLTTTAAAAVVKYSAKDAGGVASYDVRYRRSSLASGYGAYVRPAAWQATSATSLKPAVAAGHEYCFSVRARDRAGNLSAWSADHCTAVPLDDRALAISKGWTRSTGKAYLHHTVTTTSTKGAELTLAGVSARRVLVYASTCSSCGKVEVKIGKTVIGHLNLRSAKANASVLLSLPLSSAIRKGVLSIVVTTKGKPVKIDGVALRQD